MFPLSKTLKSLQHVSMIKLIILCVLLALVSVGSLVSLITFFTGSYLTFEAEWLNSLITWLVGIFTGIGGWFMLPSLTILIASFFQDRVIETLEKKEYPHLTSSNTGPFFSNLYQDVKFTGKAILLNLIILPFYFIGVGIIISFLLNSYLLGNEFFAIVASRHVSRKQANVVASQHRWKLLISGGIITLLTLIPIINLSVPILAIIWMVHVYHQLETR